ncbi:MAG: c-type cytochrome domain-containing protein, partial [Fuerstiella sp.]
MLNIFLALIASVPFLAVTATAVAAGDGGVNSGTAITAQQETFFETKIRPVLVDRCIECHSGDEPESGLNLESRDGLLHGGELGTAILPGKPEQSLLISALKHDEFIKMP